MSLSMQDATGRDSWANTTPHMNLHDPRSREQLDPPSESYFFAGAERPSEKHEPNPDLHNPDMIGIEPNLIPTTSSENLDPNHLDTTGWYSHYNHCVQYFVDTSQHTPTVQAIASFVNIRLPCQRPEARSQDSQSSSPAGQQPSSIQISLRPYVRRLIATAQDTPLIMGAFFGPDWPAGVGVIHKQERLNYLFTAKSCGWAKTKVAYDILPEEQTPFLRPLRDPDEEELRAAEARWSEWLAMEDWMVGARSPW
ncbi:hypothetical protein PDE_01652 [Penicillium oxalicum 114-2]|uniref:Uncharacterized protein n=1 Tax=Penicillium oxalicum (strain 114-2 / CGMCC 5302) TaxID=933388 RepID=S7Z929_PENO1|nr:hypothetical protein PDE_01652 [Penicillium oxalicum 114-2]